MSHHHHHSHGPAGHCCGAAGCSHGGAGRPLVLVSVVLLAAGLLLDAAGVRFFSDARLRQLWYVAAWLPVAAPVVRQGWRELRGGTPFSEFTLMSVASAGAFAIGEFPEAVAVMLFYTVGEAFQDRAAGRARRDISALTDLRPDTVDVERDGTVMRLPAEAVAVGSVVRVPVGGRVALDGIVLEAPAVIDAAALTGESLPRRVEPGDEVPAGAVACEAELRLRVTKPSADSALSRILRLVADAAERKAPAEVFIRRFARVYTPAVIMLAVLIALWPLAAGGGWTLAALKAALVFLAVSCPCALVVSVPLAYFSGIGVAARHGILFKGGSFLDAVTRLDTVAFDKTGTLTDGTFRIDRICPAPGCSEKELLQALLSLEVRSTHPLARALTAYAGAKGLRPGGVTRLRETAGLGLGGMTEGHSVLAGNVRLLRAEGVSLPADLEAEATVICCAVDGVYAGCVLFADSPRTDAARAVAELKALGAERVAVLSGDRTACVERLARQVGADEWYGDLLPEGKLEHVSRYVTEAGRRTAFVGDGINDAPVLALSHVGFAMGGAGADAAVETADVVIQGDNPLKVAQAVRIGRAVRRTVRLNILLALGAKLAVLVLGAAGMAPLWLAVLADTGVALLCVANVFLLTRRIK